MAQYVEVVAYRPEWRAVYEKERERIAAILGRNLLEIHIFERGNRRDIIRHLAVRDYLWAHSGEQEAYGALEQRARAGSLAGPAVSHRTDTGAAGPLVRPPVFLRKG